MLAGLGVLWIVNIIAIFHVLDKFIEQFIEMRNVKKGSLSGKYLSTDQTILL